MTAAAKRRTAYSLVRFSYYTQKIGDSTRRQTDLADNWLKQHPECTLDTSLNMRQLGGAKAVSAFHGKQRSKGALAAFIRAVEMGRVKRGSVLLVESLDRLSREQVEDALDLFLQIIKLGVTIVTLAEPAAEFTRGQLDMTKLIIAIVVMSRGHEESATKSRRLKEKWITRRIQAAKREKIVTGHTPVWLTKDGDNKWRIDHDKVRLIRRIFRMALTMGAYQIAKRLNQEGVPLLGRGKHWEDGKVSELLRNRRLIGEYQPCNDNRVPIGDPIVDYYPKVINEDLFYRVQAVLNARKHRRGKVGEGIACLFTGLWRDALYKVPFNVATRHIRKKTYRYMYAAAADRALRDAPNICFPYERFEFVFLYQLSGLMLRDLGETGDDRETEQEALVGQLAAVEHKIHKLSAALEESGDFDTGLRILRSLEGKRNDLQQQIDHLRAATPQVETWEDLQHVIRVIDGVDGNERTELRQRLRARIAELVDSVDVLLYRESDDYWLCADVQVNFRTGAAWQYHICDGKREEKMGGLSVVSDPKQDLRNYDPRKYQRMWGMLD